MLSLASCTFGWSNGLISSAQPATAIANSETKNSRPRSAGPSLVSVTVGWPASATDATNSSSSSRSARRRCAGMRTRGRRRTRPGRRAAHPRPAGSPCPACRSTRRRAALPTGRSSSIGSETTNVSLSRPLERELADRRRRATDRSSTRSSRSARRSARPTWRAVQQRLDVDAHQHGRHEPEVRQHRVAAADVGRVQERRAAARRPCAICSSGLPGSVTTTNCSGFALAPRSSGSARASRSCRRTWRRR